MKIIHSKITFNYAVFLFCIIISLISVENVSIAQNASLNSKLTSYGLTGPVTRKPTFNDGTQNALPDIADSSAYLWDIKAKLQIEGSANRPINIVFHGHSVPAGYFKTPVVNTMAAYPHLFLKKLKELYPYAVVNSIVTAIGGENSEAGATRFESDVLVHNPDIVLIDYALNDRGMGLGKVYVAWDKMIKLAKSNNIKVILLTPSPDQSVNYNDPENELKRLTDQIRRLAVENQVALVDTYKTFQFLYSDKVELAKYMSQVNHPNELGHELIVLEIIKWFR